jgi:hypothetical protein
MKNIFLLAVLFITPLSFGQKIDLEQIKKEINADKSPFFYGKLIGEFKAHPSALRSDSIKYQHLYYGKLYSDYYKKASEIKSEYFKFMKLAGAKKYSKAIKLGEELLDKDPVNLTVLMNLIACYKNSEGSEEKSKKLETQAGILMKAIADYGDGKSKETTFKVIALGDEFTLLNYLGINLEKYVRNSEKLDSGTILDVWIKDEKYKEDHRNKIYVQVLSNLSGEGR